MTAFWIGAVLFLGIALYWLLVSTEGTYLGPRIVALLYDWTAARYDKIKNTSFLDEVEYVGLPLAERLADTDKPLILDVATGTARVAQALSRGTTSNAYILGVDRSPKMLAAARRVCEDLDQVTFVLADATCLPMADASFDCLVCLEALEFIAKPDKALAEFLRVLKPGGQLLVSNRVGMDATSFPGRLAGRGLTEARLSETGFASIQTERWQVHYDMIWANKPSSITET